MVTVKRKPVDLNPKISEKIDIHTNCEAMQKRYLDNACSGKLPYYGTNVPEKEKKSMLVLKLLVTTKTCRVSARLQM